MGKGIMPEGTNIESLLQAIFGPAMGEKVSKEMTKEDMTKEDMAPDIEDEEQGVDRQPITITVTNGKLISRAIVDVNVTGLSQASLGISINLCELEEMEDDSMSDILTKRLSSDVFEAITGSLEQ